MKLPSRLLFVVACAWLGWACSAPDRSGNSADGGSRAGASGNAETAGVRAGQAGTGPSAGGAGAGSNGGAAGAADIPAAAGGQAGSAGAGAGAGGGTSGRGTGSAGVGGTAGTSGLATTVLYPGPAGIAASDRYEVIVDGKPSFVYQSQSQLGGADNASWTTFSFSGGAVTIQVRRLMGGAPKTVVVRPLRRALKATIEGNGATFSLAAPAKLSVEFDGDLVDKLFIFADAPEVNPPKPGDPGVAYFAPGVHDVGADYAVPSGGTLYVAGGAFVRGTFTADGHSNIKVRGRGVLSSRSFPHVDGPGQFKLRNVTNGSIEGVTLIESPGFILTGFGSHGMEYRNLKLIGWNINTDGIHAGVTAVIDDVFVFNHDDCMIIGQNSEDVQVANVVLWNTQSAALQISWVASSGQNVRVKGADVIHYQAGPSSISGAIGMRHGGSGNLKDFQFEDVVVEHFGPGSHRTFVYLEITPSAYANGPLGSLSNVLFKNVTVLDSTMDNRIIGRDADHMITDVTFENLVVDGKVALDANAAHVSANQFTNNVRFIPTP